VKLVFVRQNSRVLSPVLVDSAFFFRDATTRGGCKKSEERGARSFGVLAFWNTLAEHDSMFQKSLLLARSHCDRPCKTRRFLLACVPKMLEFAPDGQSSKIPHSSRRLHIPNRRMLPPVAAQHRLRQSVVPEFVAFAKPRGFSRRRQAGPKVTVMLGNPRGFCEGDWGL
jgi:hypothetical protein